MQIAVQVEPASGSPPPVEYRWDADTDILTAKIRAAAVGEGMSGSVDLQGTDGSWVVLDVASGRISSVEVAVWPDVRRVGTLAPPPDIEFARVIVPTRRSATDIAAVEVETPLLAEADQAERTIHLRVGAPRAARTVRLASDLLLDVDARGRIAGLWLLNVPPFPEDA